jgi:hypothetical protein
VFTIDLKFLKKSVDEYNIFVHKDEIDIFQKIKVEELSPSDFGWDKSTYMLTSVGKSKEFIQKFVLYWAKYEPLFNQIANIM